jgi:hypothetical protein
MCATRALTISDSAFYPQSVFIGFIRFSEQTVIISVNDIKELISVMVTGCSVLCCAVWQKLADVSEVLTPSTAIANFKYNFIHNMNTKTNLMYMISVRFYVK